MSGGVCARKGSYRGLLIVTLDAAQYLASMGQSGCDLRARLQKMNFYESYICHISISGLLCNATGAPRSWLLSGFPSPAGEMCIMLQAVLIRCSSDPWAVFGKANELRETRVNESFRSSDGPSPDVKVEYLACPIQLANTCFSANPAR